MIDQTYEVEWSENATNALLKISRGDKNAAKLIKQKVDQLADNPKPQKSIDLQGARYAGQRRLRIGDWRAIYRIEDGRLVVVVLEVGNRKNIYQGS